MKIGLSLIVILGAAFGLLQLTNAQCPQICDDLGNTALGAYAFQYDTTGSQNTANGYYALHFNTTGNRNTATGAFALQTTTPAFKTAPMVSVLWPTTP